MFPVRCYTCNTVLGHKHTEFVGRRCRGEDTAKILKSQGVARMCCRRMFISHVESLVENQMQYPNENIVLDRGGTTLFRRSKKSHDAVCD